MQQDVILIVEDDGALRDILTKMLSGDGFAVAAASNGVEAAKQLETLTPDLIVSDISMPEMDGYAFFHYVRSRVEWVTIPFIFLTARGTVNDVLIGKDMGAEDYLVKPVSQAELLTTVHSRLERSRQLFTARLREAYEASLIMLANAIETRDRYTRGHVERVAAYAVMLARHMGWRGKILEDLRMGAILHDIGKIHIPDRILTKHGSLTDEEWQEIKKHPTTGAEMLRDIPYLSVAVPAVRYHHERWDGSGYPEGLAGEAIPPIARIVALADALDAITTTRPYHGASSLEHACQKMIREAGKAFDPNIIHALEKAWAAGDVQRIAQAERFHSE